MNCLAIYFAFFEFNFTDPIQLVNIVVVYICLIMCIYLRGNISSLQARGNTRKMGSSFPSIFFTVQ